MNKQLYKKLKESCFSVLPITIIVLLLHVFKLIHLSGYELRLWIIGSGFAILGIGFFALGADIAMTPMGEYSGAGLFQKRNIPILLCSTFALGLLITIAEPDLVILANQVPIDSVLMIFMVALGVGLILVVGMLRIIFSIKANYLFFVLYGLLFLLVIFTDGDIVPLAFDSGGVTTGPIIVPFVMAIGLGVATVKGKNEDSFGLVALTSIGAIAMVLLLGIFNNNPLMYVETPAILGGSVMAKLFDGIVHQLGVVAIALLPIVAIFLIINQLILKLPKKQLLKIFIGIFYTYIGLVFFLATVGVSFTPIADNIGKSLSSLDNNWILIPLSFIIGFVVVLAEPAVHVLNKQVDEISGGKITKKSMLLSLTVGVGIAMALSMVRIFLGFNVLWYLIIGYSIAIILSFFVPSIYSVIAFDSGAVVSGPITAGFTLPFTIGVASTIVGTDKIMSFAFGIAAMVSLTPIITIQVLGLFATHKERVHNRLQNSAIDSKNIEIIYFD